MVKNSFASPINGSILPGTNKGLTDKIPSGVASCSKGIRLSPRLLWWWWWWCQHSLRSPQSMEATHPH